jgi:tripartite-type tricarboxylate transporter receptor subunit TctC
MSVEAGVPGRNTPSGVGMIVASRTPPPVIHRLREEVLKALARPDV